jgi:hypothetical protein
MSRANGHTRHIARLRRDGLIAQPLCLLLALMSLSPLCFEAFAATPSVRAGMPCVDEVCVGDDVLELTGVAWQPAVNPANGRPLSESRTSRMYTQRLKTILRGADAAIEAVAPYWYMRQFDAEGFRRLAGIRAVCEDLGVSGRLRATFMERHGRKTEVHFEPVPSGDGKSQRFLVAAIRIDVDRDTDSSSLDAIGAELTAKYKGYDTYGSPTKPAAVWVAHASRGPHLTLLAPIGDPQERAARLREHPDCDGGSLVDGKADE